MVNSFDRGCSFRRGLVTGLFKKSWVLLVGKAIVWGFCVLGFMFKYSC